MSKKINLILIMFSLLFFLFTHTATADDSYLSYWNITYNPSTFTEEAHDVAIDSQSRIIVVGYVSTFANDAYWNITKLYGNGTFLWNYTFDSGVSASDDRAISVDVDSSDDSFVVIGFDKVSNPSSTQDYEWRIIKFNSTHTYH